MTDTDANAVLCRIASPVLGSYRENDSRFGATAGVRFGYSLHYVGQ